LHAAARLLAALALAATALACSDGGSGSSAPIAPEAVLESERVLVDRSRPTPPKQGFAGAGERTIATRVWWAPEAPDGRVCGRNGCALVVLAHGFGGSTMRFDAYARHLAARGYVVAAPTFPLTNEAAPGGHLTGLGDLLSQPGDISFVIDEMVAASADPGDPLAGRVDGERVGVMGHSLGGATAVAVTRLPCCTDPRVDAVIGVAPATFVVEGMFGEEIAAAGPPTLSIAGERDPVVQPAGVRALHDGFAPPRVYLQVATANHVDLIENYGAPSPNLVPTEDASVAFLAEVVTGERGALEPVLERLAAEGHVVAD
jgi:dienelactone hydrolase